MVTIQSSDSSKYKCKSEIEQALIKLASDLNYFFLGAFLPPLFAPLACLLHTLRKYKNIRKAAVSRQAYTWQSLFETCLPIST